MIIKEQLLELGFKGIWTGIRFEMVTKRHWIIYSIKDQSIKVYKDTGTMWKDVNYQVVNDIEKLKLIIEKYK